MENPNPHSAKALALSGATAQIVAADGEIVGEIDLTPGEFDPRQLERYLAADEYLAFSRVRFPPGEPAKATAVPRGALETGANADWRPSAEERERRIIEARMAEMQSRMSGQVERAVAAALAAKEAQPDPDPSPDPDPAPDPAPDPDPQDDPPEPDPADAQQ